MLHHIAKLPPLRTLLLSAAQRRAERFLSRDPLAAQRRIFADLLNSAAQTRFGRDHGFAELTGLPFEKAYARFSAQTPIRNYQDFWDDYFKDNLHQQADGQKALRLKDATWPGRIGMFCETSGTTAPTKFIPFSERMFRENQSAALDMISCYLRQHPDSRIPGGKILYMSGSTALTEMDPGVFSGDMSALTLRFRPWYVTGFVEPPLETAALPWDQKLQAMAELLLRDRDIRAISGVPPWIILLIRRCCELSGLPADRALSHLELVIHGGTSIKPYRNEFDQLFRGQMPALIELLPSSEAFMGFQCAGEPAMRLTPHYGTFFEFVRMEELDDNGRPGQFATAVPLEQVQAGQRYALILSTCSGLWRYHIGDTVRFSSLAPHHMEFTGRDRFLDKLEEKVTQEEVERAVATLNSSGLFAVREFMVGADISGRRHVWVLAGASRGADCTTEAALLLDGQLRALNADYDTFRSQGRINPPDIKLVADDTIYQWSRQVRGKLGGQSKIPHIDPTQDCAMIASLASFAGNCGVHV
ncbi:MAG TPA: GH3 auxin-responsive promoter family protein [Deltaproteobacteria bacterium]|nr:GH3 auxin-responsive promoter family protein [Deltaproteobacteria bacterium]HQB39094.1 GH3 auxin-responsive promoter family protein [Deltaproteobacteria bacterium]